MRISDWSSDVCSSDLARRIIHKVERDHRQEAGKEDHLRRVLARPSVEPLPVSAGHHFLDEGAPESARQAERKKGPEHGPDPGDDRAPDRPIKHTVREGHELGRKRHKGVEHHEDNGSEDTPVAPGEDDVLERSARELPLQLAAEAEAKARTTPHHQNKRKDKKRKQTK